MLSGQIGKACTVQFKRNALGYSFGAPSAPTTTSLNGADVALTGKLLRLNAGWVCIGVDDKEFTIPRDVILLVETKAKQ
jgi:hypothetical protein